MSLNLPAVRSTFQLNIVLQPAHQHMHCIPNSFAVTYPAVTLISAYSSLEAFYLTLLPFNVLMADGAEDSSCDHEMAAHKAWVSRCRLVLEGDFLRLAAVKIQEASIREEALLKAARAKGNEAADGCICRTSTPRCDLCLSGGP